MKKILSGLLAIAMVLEMGAIPAVVAMTDSLEIQNQDESVVSSVEERFPEEGILPYDMELYADEVATISGFGTVDGTCGDKLTWELVESTGILTIRGEGDMEFFFIFHHTTLV